MPTIAVAGLIISVVSAVAAIIAAWFSAKAPTKSDLRRVEDNTAETSDRLDKVRSHIARVDQHLNEQRNQELLAAKAQRVSIAVNGNDRFDAPLKLLFKLRDPGVILTFIEMFNEVGTLFGSAECESIGDLSFIANLDNGAVQRWFSAGTPNQSFNRRLLRIRIHMQIEERMAHRDIAVNVVSGTRQQPSQPNSAEQAFILEGNC